MTDHHEFWADDIADQILATDPDEPIVIKGGISPSGVPHLGNANEIVLGYFVAEVLRERGYDVRHVFTTDDRDPLRKLPRTLANLQGELVDLGDVDAGVLGRNLGHPYTAIPDPFGCCESYGAHFTELIADIATQLDIPLEVLSTTTLYEEGRFETAVAHLLEQQETARRVLEPHQRKVDATYVPFNPICTSCGKITETVTGVNPEDRTVSYTCTDITAGDRTIDGCGHEGTVDYRGGKLPWRFEWVAQWKELGVDFEPFGKDHAEGSWPSGVDIAESIFSIDPPVPMVYEWFTLEDRAFSSSEGHVIMVSDVLTLIEPEVLRFFFSKDPSRARDFSIEHLDQLVDEFDRFEEIYFNERPAVDDAEQSRVSRIYPFLVADPDPDRLRIPYRFAAVLGMTDDTEQWERIARNEGHIPENASAAQVERALERVTRARRWAQRTDNQYNYRLHRDEVPAVEIDASLDQALTDIANVVEDGATGDDIQSAVFTAARSYDLSPGMVFSTCYELFLGRTDGPKLGPFLANLDRDFVVDRLRRRR